MDQPALPAVSSGVGIDRTSTGIVSPAAVTRRARVVATGEPGWGVSVVNASSGARGRRRERTSRPTSSDSSRRVSAQNGGFTRRISPEGPTIAVASGIPVRMR